MFRTFMYLTLSLTFLIDNYINCEIDYPHIYTWGRRVNGVTYFFSKIELFGFFVENNLNKCFANN